jgi:hypothetical protein
LREFEKESDGCLSCASMRFPIYPMRDDVTRFHVILDSCVHQSSELGGGAGPDSPRASEDSENAQDRACYGIFPSYTNIQLNYIGASPSQRKHVSSVGYIEPELSAHCLLPISTRREQHRANANISSSPVNIDEAPTTSAGNPWT